MMKTAEAAKKTDEGRNGGFSLIELCISIIISGVLFLSLFELFSGYLKTQAANTTTQNVQASAGEISLFNVYQARYPFPADPTLPYNDPNYGLEVDPATVPGGPLTVGQCFCTRCGVGGTPKFQSAGTDGTGGICMVACANGVAAPTGGVAPLAPGGNACGDGTGGANNPVLIGAIPINTIRQTVGGLNISNQMVLDGWGSQLTYAVTKKLTSAATYKYNLGAISIVDEYFQPTGGFNNDAHFAIISHGFNRSGAYTRNGQMSGTCLFTVPGAGIDTVNCSNDAEFVEAIDSSSAKGATYYDDYVYANKFGLASLWKNVQGSSDMQNQNTGSVLIGTSTAPPVAGVTMFVQDPGGVPNNGIIQARSNAKAATICDNNTPQHCFPVKAITGTDATGSIHCANATDLMTGVSNGAAVCATPTYHQALANQSCPAGQYINGLAADGTITCK